MKRTLWAVLMVALAGASGAARADDKDQKNSGQKNASQEAFLGVAVEAVSAAMRA